MNRPNPDNFLVRLWNLLGSHPLATLTGLVVAQTVLTFWRGELWYIDEVRHASALQNMLRSGNYFYLELAGQPYPDKPPLYFWLLSILAKLFNTDQAPIFFIAVAVSGVLFSYSTYALARRVAGLDRQPSLLCALTLLGTFFFLARCHSPRMDLLFSAFINFSAVCFFVGWSRPGFQPWLIAGGVFTALAVLTKGPLALAFPAFAGLAWLAWQKNLRRLFSRDVTVAVGVVAVILGGWIWACYLKGGMDLLHKIFIDQLLHRAVAAPDNHRAAHPFYFYILTMAEMWFPWTLLLFFLPWKKLFSGSTRAELLASRGRPEGGGVSFLWCVLLAELVVLSLMNYKIPIYVLVLFGPAAVLTGRALLQLPAAALRRLAVAMAAFSIMAGALLLAAQLIIINRVALSANFSVVERLLRPASWVEVVQGVGFVGGLLLALGVALFLLRRRSAGELVLITALGMALVTLPVFFLTRPSLDPINCPKEMCHEIRRRAADGYHVVSYQLAPVSGKHYIMGTLTCYTGFDLDYAADERELRDQLARRPKLLVLTGERTWKAWPDRPASLELVRHYEIGGQRWVLVAQN